MKKWITQNLVLASGIVLPVLLVGAFFILNSVPKLLTDPPKYDFVMVAYSYNYQHSANYFLSFEVREGKLTGKASPRPDSSTPYRDQANVFKYNATANSFEELTYDLPNGLDNIDEPILLTLPESDNLKLDKREQSPDGYRFEFVGNHGRGGLLGELFGMGGRYKRDYILKKSNTAFELPKPTSNTNYYQNELEFMGWVINKDADQ